VERILLASEGLAAERRSQVFVSVAKPEAAREAFALARALRREGLSVEMEQSGRSVKGQFRHADRIGALVVVIVGEGTEIKDMQSGEQRPASDSEEAVRMVTAALA
jgi:histidyl-tRNA synthetase